MNILENVRMFLLFLSTFTFLYVDLLKFDNTYSWVRSKEVFYSVKVVPPESELSEATPTKTEATPIQTNDSSSVVQDSVEIPSENVNVHTS